MWRHLLLAIVLVATAVPAVAGPSPVVNDPASEQRIPFKQTDDSASGLALRVFGALVVVILVGVGSVYVLKRYLPTAYRPAGQTGARINVLEVRRLAPKLTLFLIEVDGVRILLSQNGDRIATLNDGSAVDQAPPHARA